MYTTRDGSFKVLILFGQPRLKFLDERIYWRSRPRAFEQVFENDLAW